MKLIHSPTAVIALSASNGTVQTPHTVFTGTREECLAEVARLALADPRGHLVEPTPTPTQQARALFLSQPEEVRTQFGEVSRIVSGLKLDADKATLIEALAVPAELQSVQSQLVSILRA